jgi:hypothetical protein
LHDDSKPRPATLEKWSFIVPLNIFYFRVRDRSSAAVLCAFRVPSCCVLANRSRLANCKRSGCNKTSVGSQLSTFLRRQWRKSTLLLRTQSRRARQKRNYDESRCDDHGGHFRALPLSFEIGCGACAFMRPRPVSLQPKPVLLLSFPDTSPGYRRRSDVDLACFQAK